MQNGSVSFVMWSSSKYVYMYLQYLSIYLDGYAGSQQMLNLVEYQIVYMEFIVKNGLY